MEMLLLNKHWKHWSLAVKNLSPDPYVFKRPVSHTPFDSLKPRFHLLAWFQEKPWKITILQAELSQPKIHELLGDDSHLYTDNVITQALFP